MRSFIKKFYSSALVLIIGLTYCHAQDSLKLRMGKFATELNINLLEGKISLNNSINQIKIRYFLSDYKSLRFGFKVDYLKDYSNEENTYDVTPSKSEVTKNKFGVSVNFGYEKHFKGTERLSPYIGFDLSFADSWLKHEDKTDEYTDTYKQVWFTRECVQIYEPPYYTTRCYYVVNDRASIKVGCDFITGFDFFISKNLFIGYEFNYGIKFTDYKEAEYERELRYATTPESDGTNLVPDENDAKEFSFQPSLVNGIRLGYVF